MNDLTPGAHAPGRSSKLRAVAAALAWVVAPASLAVFVWLASHEGTILFVRGDRIVGDLTEGASIVWFTFLIAIMLSTGKLVGVMQAIAISGIIGPMILSQCMSLIFEARDSTPVSKGPDAVRVGKVVYDSYTCRMQSCGGGIVVVRCTRQMMTGVIERQRIWVKEGGNMQIRLVNSTGEIRVIDETNEAVLHSFSAKYCL